MILHGNSTARRQRQMARIANGPCRPDCPDRTRGVTPTCHSYCEKYLTWQEENYEKKRRELKGRAEGADARGFLVDRARATKKRYNK